MKFTVLLLICPRRFMGAVKFPKKFQVSYSFCQGEPGGFRKFLGVLPVYSAFGPRWYVYIPEKSVGISRKLLASFLVFLHFGDFGWVMKYPPLYPFGIV